MITYAVESWFDALPEMQPMWPLHWQELGVHKDVMPLDPDLDQYAALARSGVLHLVVARKDGQLIGYHISFVRPHLHYRTCLTSFEDLYFLHPEHRKGFMSVANLFRAVERTLRARGVKRMLCGTKHHKSLARLFMRLGFIMCDLTVSKWIGG